MGKFETITRTKSQTEMDRSELISATDKKHAKQIEDLFHKLKVLKETKDKLFKETQDVIKQNAQETIERIRSNEQSLLDEVSARHRRDTANLKKSETILKKKLDDMTNLKHRVEITRGYRLSSGSKTYARDFSQQVETEIRELIEDGKKIIENYNHVLEFCPNEERPTEIGTLREVCLDERKLFEQSKPSEGNNAKVRRNTVSILQPSSSSSHGSQSTLRRAHSTNDLVRKPRLSLCFTMSNEDLALSMEALHNDTDEIPNGKPRLVFSILNPGAGPGQINDPRDVTFLPNGDICLAEHGGQRLQLFDQRGNLKKVMQQTVFRPNGITMTREGYIAITDDIDANIKAFTRSGELVCKFGTGYFKNLTSIKANSKDHFVVIDNGGAWQQYVFVYNSMTGAKQRIGHSDNGDYVINHPAYVTADTNDNIIIADSGLHCIWTFSCDGKLQRKFGQQGEEEGQLSYPKGVCSDKSGNIYVADSANHRVCVFDSQGKFVKTILDGSHCLDYPQVVNKRGSCLAVVQRSGLLYFRLD